MQRTPSIIAATLGALATAVPGAALADGVSRKPVPLHQILSSPAYAVVVDRIQPVAGKPAISAVVREVLGSGSHPVPSSSLKVGQRVELPTYRGPKPVAHKWVIAARYWNRCRDAAPKRLLVSGHGYFETLCDTKANRSKLQQTFLGERPRDRYAKRPTATLRRGLGDPDTYLWATLALQQRGKLRDRDIIAAAHRLPDDCGVNPLFDHGGQLKGGARRAFAARVVSQLARSKRSRFARYVGHVLGDADHRALIVSALRQLGRVELEGSAAIRRVCTVVGAVAYQLKKGANAKERAAARRLLKRLARHKAFDEHCERDVRRLEQAAQSPKKDG